MPIITVSALACTRCEATGPCARETTWDIPNRVKLRQQAVTEGWHTYRPAGSAKTFAGLHVYDQCPKCFAKYGALPGHAWEEVYP